MKNQEILEKVLCKVKGYPYGIIVFPEVLKNKQYYSTIFSHDFAKAFWGEEELQKGKTLDETYEEYKEHYIDKDEFEFDWICDFEVEEAWAWYLKQMVLEKEPLKYLEKFL